MASISAIRDGLKDRLATISGLRAHDTVSGDINPPAGIIVPRTGPLSETFDDSEEYGFDVILLVSRSVDRVAQDKLDGYLAPSGSGSVVGAIAADETLGGIVDYAFAARWRDYGFITWAGIDYLGVVVEVTVGNKA